MGPKKKFNFKTFNPENVGKIEAKQKNKTPDMGNDKKSQISPGNPIEKKSPTGTEEHDTKKADNNLTSYHRNQYEENITVEQTPLDIRTSENKGMFLNNSKESKAPAYADNSQWFSNEEKPSVSRKGSYPSVMNMEESQEGEGFSHDYESRHISDETNQSRSKEFCKNRSDKNNYSTNESIQSHSGKYKNYQRTNEKSTRNWQHNSVNSNFKGDTSYTHDNTRQAIPTKSRGNQDQKGAIKKTDFYSRDNTDQDYRNRSTRNYTEQDYLNKSTRDNTEQVYRNKSSRDSSNQDYVNRTTRDSTKDYNNRSSRDSTHPDYHNRITIKDNTNQDYRNRTAMNNTNQNYQNRSARDNTSEGYRRYSENKDYDNNRNRYKTSHDYANSSSRRNENTLNGRHESAQGSIHENQQIDDSWESATRSYTRRNENTQNDRQESIHVNQQIDDSWESASRSHTRRNENTQNGRQESAQGSIHENQQIDDSWESANINWNSGVENIPTYDWKEKGSNSMLESTNLVKDKQWKSPKNTEGLDEHRSNSMLESKNLAKDKQWKSPKNTEELDDYRSNSMLESTNLAKYKQWKSPKNNNYGNDKFGNRKSDSFLSDRSEKTDTRYSSEANRSSRFSDQSSRSRRSMESYHPEYAQFKSYDVENLSFEKIKELEQDLFEMSEEYSLGHCVAADMRMGSGIAVIFKRKFNSLGKLLSQGQGSGGLAILENETAHGKRYIYYLVTKWVSSSKPHYDDFFSSLIKLRDHVHEIGVKKLALPKIGCGLDRLEWGRVKLMLAFLFRDVDVEIIICDFQQAEEGTPIKDKSCKVVFNDQPVAKIDDGTVIIYFSTEKGEIEEDVCDLSKEFNFLEQFKKSKKLLGDVIKYTHNSKYYILYGCIVRKTRNDPFDFESFEKCLLQINKNNKKDEFYYVAYQSINDKNDSYINEKITTLLRNVLRNVDVYVCKSNRGGDISIEE